MGFITRKKENKTLCKLKIKKKQHGFIRNDAREAMLSKIWIQLVQLLCGSQLISVRLPQMLVSFYINS